MKKHKYIRLILTLFAVFASSHIVWGQDVDFTLNAPKAVQVGQRFQLVYSINVNPKSFEPGSLEGLQVLAGPSTSRQSSVNIVNGQVTQNHTISYTYVVVASGEGKLTIGPGMAKVNNSNVVSNSVSIDVVKGNAPAQTPSSNQSGAGNQAGTNQKDKLFLRVLLNKREAYLGEQVVATLKLYTKYVNIADLDSYKEPSFSGFYKEDIEIPPIRFEAENVNGEIYQAAILKQFVLIPQKSGEIIIEPASLRAIIREQLNTQPRSIWDLMEPRYRTMNVTASSNPYSFTVKPLPSSKPGTFNGAVGDFKMESSISATEASTNDAITYKINISGTGNIALLSDPKIQFPATLEVFDPKKEQRITPSSSGISGRIALEYLIIPRHAGEFEIPAYQFTFFNPSIAKYQTLSTEAYTLNIAKGAGNEQQGVVTGLSKEELKYVGQDIRFIKTNVPVFRPIGFYLINNPGFYAIYAISLIGLLAIVLIRRKQAKDGKDLANVKNRKAARVAQKRLKTAKKLLNDDSNAFYDEILRVMWGYLSDKLIISNAELTRDKAKDSLINLGVKDDELIENTFAVLDKAEQAKYAPSLVKESKEDIYKNAESNIRRLEELLK